MKSVIFIAPPAAGKGTQSSILMEQYGYIHISTGDMLREEISNNTSLGVKANEIILKALDEGLIVISASGNVLRMVPPLVITRENIDEMYEKLNNVLKTFN